MLSGLPDTASATIILLQGDQLLQYNCLALDLHMAMLTCLTFVPLLEVLHKVFHTELVNLSTPQITSNIKAVYLYKAKMRLLLQIR